MMRFTSLVPSLALLVLSACASGTGSDTEPGFTDVQGPGGSDAQGGSGGSTTGGSGGASGQGGAGAGQGGASGGSGGSSGGSSGNGGASSGAAGASGASPTGGTAGSAGATGGSAGSAGGSSGASGSAGATGGTAGASGSGGKGGASGASGSAGAAGNAGKGGSAGSAGAPTCNDSEPAPKNDSELFATPACQPAPCEITDSDDAGSTYYKGPHPALAGVVGPDDVDFYKFHGTDKIGNQTKPTARTVDSGLRICVYTACKEETKDFKCVSSGATVVKSPNGLQGCCLEGPGEVQSDHDCAGSFSDDDSADVFVEVGAIDDVCTPYSVDFHF